MNWRPERYAPVSDSGLRMIASSGPTVRTRPPSAPAPGPRSTTTSASRIVSSSCSMTMSVLPRSRKVLQRRQAAGRCRADASRSTARPRYRARRRGTLPICVAKPNALRLAARERRRAAGERQVADPDVRQESEPRADFLEDLMRDHFLARRRLELAEELLEALDRHRRQFGDVQAADGNRECLGFEPRALTGLTRRRRHVLLDLFLDVVRGRFAVAPLQVLDHAFELRLVAPRMAAARLVGEALFLVASHRAASAVRRAASCRSASRA